MKTTPLEACLGVACSDPQDQAARRPSREIDFGSARAREDPSDEHLEQNALGSGELGARDGKWMDALEARLLPRIRDVVAELLDERLPGQTPTYTMSPASRASGQRRDAANEEEPPETEPSAPQAKFLAEAKQEQSASQKLISGSSALRASKGQFGTRSAGLSPLPRPSETSASSIPLPMIEDAQDITCQPGSWVMHPNGRSRWIWDSLALLVFVVDVVYTTFEWAFLSGSGRSGGVVALDILTGIFWTGDVCVNFCTGYLDSKTCLVEMRARPVAKHYLCTWFTIDFFATVQPLLAFLVQLFDDGSNMDTAKLLTLLKVLKLTKLLRVAKLSILRRRLAQIETRTQSKVIICLICIAQLLGVLLTASHIFACVLWCIGLQSVDTGTLQDSWLGSRPHVDLVNSASLGTQYMASMHLSVSIMTGMGTGAISTALVGEELVLCLYYLISLSLVGIIVNEVAAMYNKMNESSAEVSHAITGASSFMSWYKVPPSLQVRVERYLQNVFDHKEHTDFRVQLNEWLQASGGLLSELNLSIFGAYVTSHPQLRLLPREIVSQVANLCEATFFPPGEVVVKPSWMPHRTLCLRSGTMEISAAPAVVERQVLWAGGSPTQGDSPHSAPQLSEGDMLFHRNLLLPYNERSGCTCTCASFSEVMTLEFATFTSELERRHPVQLQAMRIHAAVQDDSSHWLAWAFFGGTEVGNFTKVLADETVLHTCARSGAGECIRWLLGTQGWSLDVKDSHGRTPLEIAKAHRQKAAVDALIVGGAGVKQLKVAPVWRLPRSELSAMLESARVDASSEDLAARLAVGGVDVSRFGKNGAKTVSDLYDELREGFGAVVLDEDGKAKRVLHVARIRVRAGKLTLSETEEGRWYDNSQQVLKLPMKKMRGKCRRRGEGRLEEALETLWFGYIGLGAKAVSRLFERGVPTVHEEEKSTGSYPGLDCIYIVHEVPYWLIANQCGEVTEEARCLGLPDGTTFENQEALSGGGTKVHVFTWLEDQPADTRDPYDRDKDILKRLHAAGHRGFSMPEARRLRSQEEEGKISFMEDADGVLVPVVRSVSVRLSTKDGNGDERVLYFVADFIGGKPQLPSTRLISGRIEQGTQELLKKLFHYEGRCGRSSPDQNYMARAMKSLSGQGEMSQKETSMTYSQLPDGSERTSPQAICELPILHVVYEVPFTVEWNFPVTGPPPLLQEAWREHVPAHGYVWLPPREDGEEAPAYL